jgi:hypothetical protein
VSTKVDKIIYPSYICFLLNSGGVVRNGCVDFLTHEEELLPSKMSLTRILVCSVRREAAGKADLYTERVCGLWRIESIVTSFV